MLTSIAATALVMLPFAIAGNIPGLEVVHPMAIVILGGLVTTTLLALFVLPALYLRFGAGGQAERVPGGGDHAQAGRHRARVSGAGGRARQSAGG